MSGEPRGELDHPYLGKGEREAGSRGSGSLCCCCLPTRHHPLLPPRLSSPPPAPPRPSQLVRPGAARKFPTTTQLHRLQCDATCGWCRPAHHHQSDPLINIVVEPVTHFSFQTLHPYALTLELPPQWSGWRSGLFEQCYKLNWEPPRFLSPSGSDQSYWTSNERWVWSNDRPFLLLPGMMCGVLGAPGRPGGGGGGARITGGAGWWWRAGPLHPTTRTQLVIWGPDVMLYWIKKTKKDKCLLLYPCVFCVCNVYEDERCVFGSNTFVVKHVRKVSWHSSD